MTIVFIENVWGSGQIITVSESFKDHVVSRRLEPGDNLRIAMSRFKSISIDEQIRCREARIPSQDDAGAG